MTSPWPNVAPQTLTEGQPIVVLAPHPDDESLGCGALLAHAFATTSAHVICLTDGGASHPGSAEWPPTRLAERRRKELQQAVSVLGGTRDDLTWLGRPDGRLHKVSAQEVADLIVPVLTRIGATRLFAPAIEDHHADHKAAARIARLVATSLPEVTLFSYPVWSRWDDPEFAETICRHRSVGLDVGSMQTLKRRAIEAHTSQLQGSIPDDPDGFAMDPAFIDLFVTEPEIFWRTYP